MENEAYTIKLFSNEELSESYFKELCTRSGFMSFDDACNLFASHLGIDGTPVAYKMTDKGIEIYYQNFRK